jgi:spore germination cell wall hydrolase CwlJ-like protein
MKRTILTAAVFAVIGSYSVAAEKLTSFDHAAELTSQAKQILFQQLNEQNAHNASHPAITCLAENIYFEARGESFKAKIAVANVTRNRVEDARWPSTYCGVVQQGPVRESWKTRSDKSLAESDRVYYPKKHRCQFSWFCDGAKDIIWANKEQTGETIEGNARAWRESVRIAIAALGQGDYIIRDNTLGATHYYNHNLVDPNWADSFETTVVIGNHTFKK